ncbi:Rpn family recombination-promoting nuclease/putative transposase [uncultured Parabacteroides sp.]|uniref:Rpn family recombination-promoting nuclease/putative transposase n=1 Tax=uncultured Parabacteroides sp. TaxID=512312 RepID=UPI0025D0B117|nr:Rpn family recombination-promoting nuclease/putative transposase [uncultured Parabacteroides sp.]
MENQSALVRFDWAVKRLLRNKSNFVILEGFLSTLLEEKITIVRLLESEGNKDDGEDKFNRVDMLAEDGKGELIIIEVQNNRELDYFHRMLYGASKAITEYINEGQEYGIIRKVYSINIVYFELGQGKDYVYHGRTVFKGIHYDDVLQLSIRQREQFVREEAGDIFPEYYVLRVEGFNKQAKTPLDEWIEFLKTGEIAHGSTAPGLQEASERLRIDQLSPSEKQRYYSDMEAIRYQRSVIKAGWIEGRAEGLAEGRVEGRVEGLAEGRVEGLAEGHAEAQRQIAINLKKQGLSVDTIAQCTGLSPEEISSLPD